MEVMSVSQTRLSILKKISYGVFTSVFGSVILVLFLSTIIDMQFVKKSLWLVLCFNSAVTGFSVIEKTQNLRHQFITSGISGILTIALSCLSLNIITFSLSGKLIVGAPEFFIFTAIGYISAAIGALLAMKHRNLKTNGSDLSEATIR